MLLHPKAQRSSGLSDGFLQRTLTLRGVRELRATPCFKETKMPDNVAIQATTKPQFTASKIKKVAEQSWWKCISKRKLAEQFDLTEAQVNGLRSTPKYQRCV